MYGMHSEKQESHIILFNVHAAFLMNDDESCMHRTPPARPDNAQHVIWANDKDMGSLPTAG